MKAAKTKRTAWSPERRKIQSERIQTWRPWEWSTGPRTAQGKATSVQNALKHGLSKELAELAKLLREHKRVLDELVLD